MSRYEAPGSISNIDQTRFQIVIYNGNLLITKRAIIPLYSRLSSRASATASVVIFLSGTACGYLVV